MDKIVIKSEDLDPLFEWRDKHLDLVLRCPCPLKAVEIHVEPGPEDELESPFFLRCIREKPNRLRLYLGSVGDRANGYFLLEHLPNGKWLHLKDTIKGANFQPDKKGFGDSVVAVYATLMALMVYASEFELPALEGDIIPPEIKPRKKHKAGKKKPPSGVVYILRRKRSSISIVRHGAHASPSGIFTVRGHWRRYKNGNVIWISEYKKGTGNRKKKTYKLEPALGKAHADI